MNKNTRRARKQGLSNNPEYTIGTGEKRTFGSRTALPVVKGVCVDSRQTRRGPKRYPEISFATRRKEGW